MSPLLFERSNITVSQCASRLLSTMHSVYFTCYQTFYAYGQFGFSICYENISLIKIHLYYLNKDVQDGGWSDQISPSVTVQYSSFPLGSTFNEHVNYLHLLIYMPHHLGRTGLVSYNTQDSKCFQNMWEQSS